jgi:hypothetical protein
MLDKRINATNIALVPQSPFPRVGLYAMCFTEFQPKSLSNVLYKLVSKVLQIG